MPPASARAADRRDNRGRDAASPFAMPATGWKDVLLSHRAEVVKTLEANDGRIELPRSDRSGSWSHLGS